MASNPGETPSFTSVQGGNLKLESNSVTSENSNGNILLNPNGTGAINFPDLTASKPLKLDGSNNVISSDLDLTNQVTGVLPVANGGTSASTLTLNNVILGNGTSAPLFVAPSTSGNVLESNGTTWLSVPLSANLASEVTGVLPLANGGTNKNATANNGAIFYSDADSLELLGPGTSGQILQTNGAAAPSFVAKSISGKAQNVAAVTIEEIQTPNNLLTLTGTNAYLVESGNNNLLVNPSFEHTTIDTGWTYTGAGATTSVENTEIIHGKQSLKITQPAASFSLVQDSTLYANAFTSGTQCLASVRIRTTNTALKICSRNAGTTSTDNCVTASSDDKWWLYQVPFICGATSNGISIATVVTSGTTYVDEAYAGVTGLVNPAPLIGPWITYTPTLTGLGFGTPTAISFKWRQVGQNMEVQGVFTPSAVTAVLGNIPLPTGYTLNSNLISVANTTANPGQIVGQFGQDWSSAGVVGRMVTATGTSTSVVYFGKQMVGGTDNLTPALSSANFGASRVISVHFSVPVTELAASTSIYNASCGANCVDTFTATSSAAGVISEERTDFITSCTNANPSVCTFVSNIFTVAPDCVAEVDNDTFVACYAYGESTSGFNIKCYDTAAGIQTTIVTKAISCTKTGADFVASRTIQGSFKNVNVTTGSNKPIAPSWRVSATGTVSGELGDAVSGNCTNATSTVCTFNSVWASAPNCFCTVRGGSKICNITQATMTTSAVTIERFTDAGAGEANEVTVFCHGEGL